MTENPVTKEQIQEELEGANAVVGRNRWERRFLEKAKKREKIKTPRIAEVHYLAPIGNLYDEEDLLICQQELKDYELMQTATRLSLERVRLYRLVGVPDSDIRTYFADFSNNALPEGTLLDISWKSNPRKVQQQRKAILNYQSRCQIFSQRNGYRFLIDEEEREIISSLVKSEDISIEELLREVIRSRSESIELIKLQIEWLAAQSKPQDQIPEEQATEEAEPTTQEKAVIATLPSTEIPYSLLDWNLYWTRRHWSAAPNHLVAIPTDSRTATLDSIAKTTRGEISIKPKSILRTLEFHLQKSIIQKAHSARNKYGHEGIKDWVKLKRGGDRIFFLVDEAGKSAIFFAAGRDIVYRI